MSPFSYLLTKQTEQIYEIFNIFGAIFVHSYIGPSFAVNVQSCTLMIQ